MDVLNQYLRVVLEPLDFAFFFHHQGLQNPSAEVLLSDGVHLNSKGQYLLYRSYRGAILSAKDMVGVRVYGFRILMLSLGLYHYGIIFKFNSSSKNVSLPELSCWQLCMVLFCAS